ncbi:branched-chain amino acid ABC transporter substrate-binding protein [Herbaspirillum sp. ST 5-3]|uniref:branched-chain amino acid ABC transporter substrate-binding protein n=1 Tax=Oxalobacteraceae TaxID=75682 RepID=UPI0010A4AA02|nr:branched-chain amino acid ABC transporter substrate-binding protein [Herbaspirillum sp. ST 5-3]
MKRFIRIACAMAVIALLGACSRQITVKIGVVAPMSGPLAQYGKDIANGAQLAVEELNRDYFTIGGRRARFELVVEDDKASPDEGKAAAKRLIDADIAAVFGHFNSGVSIAAAPLYAQAGIPQLSVSTNPKYTRMGLKTAFRITADDIQQGATLARLITDKLRAKSLYIVDDRTIFGVGIADEVGRIVQTRKLQPPRESLDPKNANYAALAKQIRDANADTVFFGGDEAGGLPLLKALRQAGSSARFVVADAMCDNSTVKGAQGNADANYYCTIAGVPPSWLSSGIGFTEMYKTRFGVPGAYSTLSYDGIHVLAQAMQQAGSAVPANYLPTLAKGAFSGKVQGSIEFDDKGDIKDGTVVIYKSVGGQLIEQRDLL